MLQEDSADSSEGSGSGAGDFPEGKEPALLGHASPRTQGLDASSAQELPGQTSKRKSLSSGPGSVAPYRSSPPVRPCSKGTGSIAAAFPLVPTVLRGNAVCDAPRRPAG